MHTSLHIASQLANSKSTAVIGFKNSDWSSLDLTASEAEYIKHKLDEELLVINRLDHLLIIAIANHEKPEHLLLEQIRVLGSKVCKAINQEKYNSVQITTLGGSVKQVLAFSEGVALSNYQFLKYRSDADKKSNTLSTVTVIQSDINQHDIDLLSYRIAGTCVARDLVNEPQSYLTAPQLSEEIKKHGQEAGFKVEVFNKAKITSLKMSGILAVNAGSITPPTFSILEWKPADAKNTQPIILVGKGVVYDTGGLSLKPTPNSMDHMKCDMAGAAAVVGALYTVAKSQLPFHVIGLIPATDNRPGVNAYAPGDVITMYSGKTVEVLNTDAEGRMILADALAYAQKFNPALVIDLATLTGSAAAAIGRYGIVGMGTADAETKQNLAASGEQTYERVVEFPFWQEYGDLIKSDIADIKNLGGPHAGAITAGKFLEHFTDYPWIHLDIAGPAFLDHEDHYRGKHGTGIGVRLLTNFIQNQAI